MSSGHGPPTMPHNSTTGITYMVKLRARRIWKALHRQDPPIWGVRFWVNAPRRCKEQELVDRRKDVKDMGSSLYLKVGQENSAGVEK